MQVLFILGFVLCAVAFTPLSGVPPGWGGPFPTYLVNSQTQKFPLFPYTAIQRFVNVGTGCTAAEVTGNITGKVAIVSPPPVRSPCGLAQVQRVLAPFNPVAIFVADDTGEENAWSDYEPYESLSDLIPIFYTGYVDPYTNPICCDPTVLGFPALFFFGTGPNFTATIDYPTQNPFLNEMRTISWTQAWIFTALGWGLINMLIGVFKLGGFVISAGKIQFSIPNVVLSLVVITSFWVFLTYGILGGTHALTGLVSTDTVAFLIPMTLGWFYTAIVVLGFYFGEVASLTSAQKVPGLDKMRIPAAIWIVILWAIIFAIAGVGAADPQQSTLAADRQPLITFFFVFQAVLLPFLGLLPLIWGIITLLKGLSGSSNKTAIARIVGLAVALIILCWTLIFCEILFSYPVGGVDEVTYHPPWTPMSRIWITAFLWIPGILAGCSLILFTFTVTVQNEIEVSKSATSSTSSGSSSKGNSSSSSSSNDPVIEL